MVVLHRQNNIEATDELIKRFERYSRKEAAAFLNENKHKSLATFSDLVQVGLQALLSALESYSFKGGFFSYWQIIARQEMVDLIKELSVGFATDEIFIGRGESDFDPFECVVSSGDDVVNSITNELQIEMIVNILSNHDKYGIKQMDADMFRLCYFDLLSYSDIAKLYNIKYYTVWGRIEKTRKKIKYILCKTDV